MYSTDKKNVVFYSWHILPYYINPSVFIGKEGVHLKRITKSSGSEYIWFNSKRKYFEIYGSNQASIHRAHQNINGRITALSNKFFSIKTEFLTYFNETYSYSSLSHEEITDIYFDWFHSNKHILPSTAETKNIIEMLVKTSPKQLTTKESFVSDLNDDFA